MAWPVFDDIDRGNAPKVLAVGLKDTPVHPKLAAAHLEVRAVCRRTPECSTTSRHAARRCSPG
ncbi:hypothetical protein ACFYRC_14400 [Streptomyces sp. NPDC005279]|uniref:hypothetical protein n=1 Tax=Streptomyces sp. NPDC005279 TaxID=3364712 RepID=UPI0036B8D8C5